MHRRRLLRRRRNRTAAGRTGWQLPPPAAAVAASDTSAAAPKTPEPEREKAEVGMGKKGHYEPGILTTPLSIYFRAEERITFNIKIPKAMELVQGDGESDAQVA